MEEEKRTKIELRLAHLRQEAVSLGDSLTGSDPEYMQTLDAWYDAVREIEEIEYGMRPPFLSGYLAIPKGMVVLRGGDYPLMEGLIDENCKLVVTEEALKKANP